MQHKSNLIIAFLVPIAILMLVFSNTAATSSFEKSIALIVFIAIWLGAVIPLILAKTKRK